MKTINAKTIARRAAAAGIASLMAGTTLVGGLAANLANLPAPFVQDGQADVLFVLGQNAAVQDVLGSIDIATALQANAVTEEIVNVPGSSTDYTVADGQRIERSGNALNFGESFNLNSSFRLDSAHFPTLLADGTVRDVDDGDDWDYDQEIQFDPDDTGYPKVTFGIPSSSDVDLPQLFVDFGSNDAAAYRFVVDFRQNANLSALDDSESIEIFGKPFTFDPSNTASDSDVTLFGSDVVTFLELNTPQTIVSDGETYEVEVVGANSDGTESIILSVNGQRQTVREGQSRTIAGVKIFVQDVFVTNIPTLDASATIFVGSEEYKINVGSFDEVELNGNTLDGLYANVTGSSSLTWNAVDELWFEYRPADSAVDDDEYLLSGESIRDPMFDIEMIFAGATPSLDPELDERSYFSIDRSSDKYGITFTNRDGDTYKDIRILEQVGNDDSIQYTQSGNGNMKRLVLNPADLNAHSSTVSGTNLTRDDFFFTYEGGSNNPITKVYTVKQFDEKNNVETVTFRDLSTGKEEKVEVGDTLGSTGLVIGSISRSNRIVSFSSTTADNIVNWFVTEGDMKVFLSPVTGPNGNDFGNFTVSDWTTATVDTTLGWHNATGNEGNTTMMFFDEDFNNRFATESADAPSTNWTLSFQGDNSGEDIEIASTTLSNGQNGVVRMSGDGSSYDNYQYAMTPYGSYIVEETDKSGSSYRIWYPKEGEANYAVFVAPSGSEVSSSSSSAGQIVTQTINPIPVDASRLDVDVDLATVSSNIIVVGGPRANSIAYELLGMPTEEAIDELFSAPGVAWIKLFDLDSGKVAMLVAGYSAQDTQAASRAVATFDSRLTGDEAKLTVASLNSFEITSTQ